MSQENRIVPYKRSPARSPVTNNDSGPLALSLRHHDGVMRRVKSEYKQFFEIYKRKPLKWLEDTEYVVGVDARDTYFQNHTLDYCNPTTMKLDDQQAKVQFPGQHQFGVFMQEKNDVLAYVHERKKKWREEHHPIACNQGCLKLLGNSISVLEEEMKELDMTFRTHSELATNVDELRTQIREIERVNTTLRGRIQGMRGQNRAQEARIAELERSESVNAYQTLKAQTRDLEEQLLKKKAVIADFEATFEHMGKN